MIIIDDYFILICQCSIYKCRYRATFFREKFTKINMIDIKAMNE